GGDGAGAGGGGARPAAAPVPSRARRAGGKRPAVVELDRDRRRRGGIRVRTRPTAGRRVQPRLARTGAESRLREGAGPRAAPAGNCAVSLACRPGGLRRDGSRGPVVEPARPACGARVERLHSPPPHAGRRARERAAIVTGILIGSRRRRLEVRTMYEIAVFAPAAAGRRVAWLLG